jgi:hypothetical protein
VDFPEPELPRAIMAFGFSYFVTLGKTPILSRWASTSAAIA